MDDDKRMRAGFRHRAAAVAIAAMAFSFARDAGAEASELHRLRILVSPWSFGFYDLPGSDGHYSQKGVWAGEGRVAYGYRWSRHFEIGGFASATVVQEGRLKFYRLQGVARGVIPMGDDFEVGGQLRVGIQSSSLFDWSYIGPAVAVGVDAEARLADPVSLAFGVDLALSTGAPVGVPSGGQGDYFRDASLFTGSIVPYVGVSFRF